MSLIVQLCVVYDAESTFIEPPSGPVVPISGERLLDFYL